VRTVKPIARQVVLVSVGIVFCSHVKAQTVLQFTDAQADGGKATYEQNCVRCHGAYLQGGEFGPPLLGRAFVTHWANRPLGSLFSFIKTTMPPGRAGSLPDASYLSIVAYILEKYGVQSGPMALRSDIAQLDALMLPAKDALEPYTRAGGSAVAPNIVLPAWPTPVNPLEGITPISDTLLQNPPDGSWLSWRRTRDAAGFSPLKKISKRNVHQLRVAWAFALPPGPNEATPLVHDGVIFVESFGDHIHALDAATGDQLWHYHRDLPHGSPATVHRNIALYDDKLYFVTSDAHVIALKIKTGTPVWDQFIGDSARNVTLATGGPIIVDGVVMQGVIGALSPGGGYVAGLDAGTGRVLWRFDTIARPGERNGNSWNGLPLEKRTGGSVWTAGSYDSKTGLAFFGPAPTYDTQLLRVPVSELGVNSDALYTNATVALDPKTGHLAWYYQHLPNDQWDFDWAFERQVVDLKVGEKTRRLVVTSGKEAIYDALDAETGQYVFSMDLGLQNLITAIDPKTGKKTIDSRLVPGEGKTVTVCPYTAGAKSWLPGSYDSERRILYVPLVESCMDISATSRDPFGGLRVRPPLEGDGRYGRVEAINMETRKTLWTMRQRAPQTTGVLATAGGVVFSGALDRWFSAYATDTGTKLWSVRLSDVPSASPISYVANGRQYVAVVVGGGYGQTVTFLPLVPEIAESDIQSSAIWVFALSE
jgi:alcohol dehydrogenase (cytochrome c)